ncbi:MauE/DoxX family redox-associated membrane protein [Paenibacillus sp. Marseille-Q4541]|uniref:MauE/DoxX family redox-associated membrane protein n=1 Tax=Paenibacillus sp. Marseille-Q4541 TaxID=2831522 RepID=UPI001BA7DBE2|nr:MauE/DoxX family redox-associated membrane protein [Paenibacillus sp. Marseille-Q4541]
MNEIAAVFVSFPMFLSIVSYIWSKVFRDPHHFPGNSHTHLILIMMQFISVTLLFGVSSVAGLLFISLLYFIQGIGVVYFLLRNGKVDCGCFGSQIPSKLSYRLAAGNGLMTIISLYLFLFSLTQGDTGFFSLSLEGLIVELMMMLIALLCIVGVPDAIYAIRAYRAIAATYYAKIMK